MQRAVQPTVASHEGVAHRPRTDAFEGQQALGEVADGVCRGRVQPGVEWQLARLHRLGQAHQRAGFAGGEAHLSQARFAQGQHPFGIGVAEQSVGKAQAACLDHAAADGHGRAHADLLAGDGPAQCLERRGRGGHAQAGLARQQGAELRVMAVGLLEGFDVLLQAQHALHHGFECRLPPCWRRIFGGRGLQVHVGVDRIAMEVQAKRGGTAMPDQALAQAVFGDLLGHGLGVTAMEGQDVLAAQTLRQWQPAAQ